MEAVLTLEEIVERDRGRLRSFIRKRVPDPSDAEDILQDVLYELVDSTKPIEQVTAWLFRVASNRIIDRFRRQKHQMLSIDDLLPSPEGGPDAAYARSVLVDEMGAALDELPKEQRDVFIAHEIEGRSFKEMSEESGVPVNTLLSRKHYAVLHLRRRLQEIYEEFK
jgi:RNA polymerase sigma factor (sigma-70 family)